MIDHRCGTNKLVDPHGAALAGERQLYKPWGEKRLSTSISLTRVGDTGQYDQAEIGLMFYQARWYDSTLGCFVQPDSIIPESIQGTQAFDRYAYVNSSPINFNDPAGRMINTDAAGSCGPSCLMNLYGYDTEKLDRSLEDYSRNNPTYNPSRDPELAGTVGAAIMVAAQNRASCMDGSDAACIALVYIAGLGSSSPRPAGSIGEQPGPNYGADGLGDPDCAGCGYYRPFPNSAQGLIAESASYSSSLKSYNNSRPNPFDVFQNLATNVQPIPGKPGYYRGNYVGGGTVVYRPTSSTGHGYVTIDFHGVPGLPPAIEIKFPFAR